MLKQMQQHWLRTLGWSLCCFCCATLVWAAETPLPSATNLQAHAVQAAKRGEPLIVLVSLADCSPCEQVRKLHLAPLAKNGAVVRQIEINSDAKLIDFDGKPTTQKDFAHSAAVKVAPTVLFFNSNGKQVASSLVGTMLDDFYGAYLDDAIATAKKQISGGAGR
jgi:thioredoxin-related protein